jgi:DNA topoisomerase-1
MNNKYKHIKTELLKQFLKTQFSEENNNDNDNNDNNDDNDNDDNDENKQNREHAYKWHTLEHNGPKFPDEYVQKFIPIIYEGNEILLGKEAEEAGMLYAKFLDTEYTKKSIFNRNFFSDWKIILGQNSPIKSLAGCDFSLYKNFLEQEKEQKKKKRKEQKVKKITVDTENSDDEVDQMDQDDKYKYAVIDGKIEMVSNYIIEKPSLLIGRGSNVFQGRIKKRIQPEDVTINIGKEAKIPEPPLGHNWANVIHDRRSEWLDSWKDEITGKTKYVRLSAQSEFKASNDLNKFNLARKLKTRAKHIAKVNEDNMKSDNDKIKQTATALFFVDKLALRVGGEASSDINDAVGVTTLQVSNIDLHGGNTLTLNFLGKDSIPYENTIIVGPLIYNNVKEFMKGKDPDDQIFDKITASDVNKYLQEFLKDLTAKVYRSYNASNLFQKELKKIDMKYEHDKDITTSTLLDDFLQASIKVAKLLNHKKAITKGYKEGIDRMSTVMKKLKSRLRKALQSTKKNPEKIAVLREKISAYKKKLELKKDMKDISIGTSQQNYIDPRITIAWMKRHNIPIEKIFPKALQDKFKWAFDTDQNYKF